MGGQSPSDICHTSGMNSNTAKVIYGFHAVGVRVKTAPDSIIEIYIEPTRRDARMRGFLEKAKEANVGGEVLCYIW